jgi:hypothetical protein
MNAWTDWSDNSCSRTIRPGVLGPTDREEHWNYVGKNPIAIIPVSHLVIEALIAANVVPPTVRLQSAVLDHVP